jgi:acetylornithine deacetylase/succinyl-diaminopimelate desuccinylase-like protein
VTRALNRDGLLAFAERRRTDFEDLLRQFVGIPTVSADPEHRPDIDRAAELAATNIEAFGGVARVLPTGGNPLVHGLFVRDAAFPTVVLYNHLDVQPASRESESWRTDPFTLTRRGDRYFGRGATDDKGPALTALLGIAAARQHELPVNVSLLWEFEEEIGSPHFEAGLDAIGASPAPDSVLVSDTGWLSREQPSSIAGLRGYQGFRLTLETGGSDRHSGDVGGAARNPIGELAGLLTKMHDPVTGEVRIPGFHDEVVPPTEEEIEDFRRSGFSLEKFRETNELRSLRVTDPLEVMRRTWALPTFEVHGIDGGYAGAGIKAIVPWRAEAKVSCRLVPEQRPERIVELVRSFVREHAPDVEVHAAASAHPYRGVTTGRHAAALSEAMEFAFGRRPVFIRDGGSIGPVTTMAGRLGCPILFLGISLPEHGYHAPNENFDWTQARGGILAFARYFEIVARRGRRS